MNAIAIGNLNSQEVWDTLKIKGIEKFNPDNPDLPENVRARLDELAEDGKTIRAFYDKTTNKIFVNENLTNDAEIRASVAREWKISEDLKDEKGKANNEGKLKSTVAGELAYDDMMKRAGEGKTGSISTGELNEAVMDVDSEVTSDLRIVNPEGALANQYTTQKQKNNVHQAFYEAYGNHYYKKIDWNNYKNKEYYRYEVTYYYLTALNIVKDKKEITKDFRRVSESESVFHNFVGDKIYLGNNANIKLVNIKNGKEVVLDNRGNIVKDPKNIGTFNYYTYELNKSKMTKQDVKDKINHGVDIYNWIKFGSGINDTSTVEERWERFVLGSIVSANYNSLKKWVSSKPEKNNLIGMKEVKEYYKETGINLIESIETNIKIQFDISKQQIGKEIWDSISNLIK